MADDAPEFDFTTFTHEDYLRLALGMDKAVEADMAAALEHLTPYLNNHILSTMKTQTNLAFMTELPDGVPALRYVEAVRALLGRASDEVKKHIKATAEVHSGGNIIIRLTPTFK